MRDDEPPAGPAPERVAAPPRPYEPPRLWEYGTLRLDTAGANTLNAIDGALNYSFVP